MSYFPKIKMSINHQIINSFKFWKYVPFENLTSMKKSFCLLNFYTHQYRYQLWMVSLPFPKKLLNQNHCEDGTFTMTHLIGRDWRRTTPGHTRITTTITILTRHEEKFSVIVTTGIWSSHNITTHWTPIRCTTQRLIWRTILSLKINIIFTFSTSKIKWTTLNLIDRNLTINKCLLKNRIWT